MTNRKVNIYELARKRKEFKISFKNKFSFLEETEHDLNVGTINDKKTTNQSTQQLSNWCKYRENKNKLKMSE